MSPRVLSDKAQTLLADLPPFLREDGMVQGVVQAQAGELQRIEDAATAILGAIFPAEAQDLVVQTRWTARMLSMWESMVNLPVAPVGVVTTERQAKVLAHIQGRNSGAGSDWIRTLSQAIGSTAWTHQEGPGAYTVTITVPASTGSYLLGQIGAIARLITPAHLDIIVSGGAGFIVGVSRVGIEPL